MTATDANDKNAETLQHDLTRLGLLAYVEDLDNNGFTVIPPSIANPDGLADRMLSVCLDIAKTRMRSRPDLACGETCRERPVEHTFRCRLSAKSTIHLEAIVHPVKPPTRSDQSAAGSLPMLTQSYAHF